MGLLNRFFGGARRRREEAESGSFEERMADPEHLKRIVYAYHEQTKHSLHRFAIGPHELDWENQPDPFRRWKGAELIPLDQIPLEEQPDYVDALVEGGVHAGRPEPEADLAVAVRQPGTLGVETSRRRALGPASEPVERQPPSDRGLPARTGDRGSVRHPRGAALRTP